ncbi:hypothetical protein Tco_1149564 [Tanacetum coccineum]
MALFVYLKKVREVIGIEDREVTRYKAKLEDRARREEELFTRAPLSSVENKKLKHMRKSRFWGCSDHQKTVTKLYVPVLERAITRLAAGTTNNDANSESNSTQNESTNTSYIKKALLAKSQGIWLYGPKGGRTESALRRSKFSTILQTLNSQIPMKPSPTSLHANVTQLPYSWITCR